MPPKKRLRLPRILLTTCGTLSTVAGLLSGSALQLPAQVPGSPPAPLGRVDSSAFVAGGEFGYGAGAMRSSLGRPGDARSSSAFGSMYGGLLIGYSRHLLNAGSVGLEGDVLFPNFLENGVMGTRTDGRDTVSTHLDALATLRGRVGVEWRQATWYGTAGVAWSVARTHDPRADTEAGQLSRTIGWTVGAGVERAATSGWVARVEYRYTRLGPADLTLQSSSPYAFHSNVHTLLAGLSHPLGERGERIPAGARGPRDSERTRLDDWMARSQSTLIEQAYPAFRSPYEGLHSLEGASQGKNTFSATTFAGYRVSPGTEVYIDPELMQGFGLNRTFGVAGFPNGEAQKAGFLVPRFNVARAFIRKTIGFGGPQEPVDEGSNQLAGTRDVSRATITIGKFAVTDIFDQNTFANDPRVNFLNWNLYGAGAYDWTMDQISWTWGAVAELNQGRWALRAGYFLVPTVSSTNTFDMHIPERGEYAGELETRYSLREQPGTLRAFAWVNRAVMGSFAEAVGLSPTSPGYPDIALTRRVRANPGLVLNADQAVNSALGVFSRVSWDGGHDEQIGGTNCDASASLGALVKGTSWGRPQDRIGIGGVVDALSHDAQTYFARGGLGILIGDGRLNYREERIVEGFYSYELDRWFTLSLDYQFVRNPAYNADRGPVSIFAGRIHVEF